MSKNLQEKLRLQARDVKYLQDSLIADAHDKLNLHLPQTEATENDPLRQEIESLIEQFVYNTFENARHSIILDDIPETTKNRSVPLRQLISEPKEEVEPFDFALNEKLRDIYRRVEDETLKVTALRRQVPEQSRLKLQEMLESTKQQVDALESAAAAENLTPDQSMFESVVQDTTEQEDEIPRIETISQDYQGYLLQLAELKSGLTGKSLNKLDEIIDVVYKQRS